jgi:hypothetical protein
MLPQIIALGEVSGSEEDRMIPLDELRCVLLAGGGQYAMTAGKMSILK